MLPFRFRLGGHVVEIRTQKNAEILRDWPHPFYTPFRTQEAADIKILISRGELPPVPSSDKRLFDGKNFWQLFDLGAHYQMDLFNSANDVRDRCALISKDFSEIQILLTGKTKWWAQKVLRPLLEITAINFLGPRKGLLLHGAAVRDGNKGFLFIGASGRGKTTISQLWSQKEGDISVLGDERTIVQKDADGSWCVYGTPWPGLGFIVEKGKVPLSHVFFITHGRENKALEIPKPLAFQELFTQVFSSFWDKARLDEITQTCEDIVKQVPCRSLPFLKDVSVTDYIREYVSETVPA